MKYNIFYSWQSDLHNSTNRSFIQKALENAVKTLKAEHNLTIEPVIDRDTAGVPGSPDIAQTIFAKIEQSQVFVCDVSIINQGSNHRLTPNPNILVELGYAIHTLEPSRIIMVINTAFGVPEQLPFDLRGRRVLDYCVTTEQTEKAPERRKLEKKLVNALIPILSLNIPPITPLDRLNVFKETAECKKLITNPHKIGYVPIFLPILIWLIVIVLMPKLIIKYFNDLVLMPKAFSNLFLYVYLVVVIFLLGFFLVAIYFFIVNLKRLFRGERLIKWGQIECIPVWIISNPTSISVKFDNAIEEVDRITLADPKGDRFEVIQRRISDRASLIINDIGVAYLKRKKFGSLGETWIIVDFQRAMD